MFCCEFGYEFAESTQDTPRNSVSIFPAVYHLHVKFLAVNFAEVGSRLSFVKVGVSPMPFTLPS